MKLKFNFLLFTSFLLVACELPLTTTYSDGVPYRALVKPDASFIGEGLTVKTADPKWDWYLPDLNSSAQVISRNYQLPADKDGATYLRSFSLYDSKGFVWRWQNKDTKIFLIYTFVGDNGYFLRTIHNIHNITVDEAILANFFHDEFSSHLKSFEVKKWIIKNADNTNIGVESLGFQGDELSNQSKYFTFFEDRIMTFPRLSLKKERSTYRACPEYFSEVCYSIPNDFNYKLENAINSIQNVDLQQLCVQLKVTLSTQHKIKKVIAGILFECDIETTPKVHKRWPIPNNYLGAGIEKGLISYDVAL